MFNRLLHRTQRRPPAHRGQALVEFALVLPLLALLLVMAIDFGRVFFGWVALQNSVRIGADHAAQNANAWPDADPGTDEVQAQEDFQRLINSDMRAANCTPTEDPHPGPTFTDFDADGDDHEFGDLVTVALQCQFDLITPLASQVLGGPITLGAESTFAIHGVISQGVPDPPPPPPEPCGAADASFTSEPPEGSGNRVEGTGPTFLVTFTASQAETPDCELTYSWEVDGAVVGTDDPVLADHPFTDPAGGPHTDYRVTLTVTDEDLLEDEDQVTVRVNTP